MMSAEQQQRIAKLVSESVVERGRVRRLVADGKWTEAEPEPERVRAYFSRRAVRRVTRGAEAIQGPTLDLQPASFLAEGAAARRAVALVTVNAPRESTTGSGFLVSPRLFLTNQHVVRDAEAARHALVTFDLELDERGAPRPATVFALDPERFALFSDEQQLDYALVAIGAWVSGRPDTSEFGWLPLGKDPDRHVLGMAVDIVQHPGGRPKMIAIRNNLLSYRTPTTLLYETDTETGSSGAPVLNDDWDVVALHHWAAPMLERTDEAGRPIPSTVNEGVRISAIVEDLASRRDALRLDQRQLLDEVLSPPPPAPPGGRRLSPPHRAGPEVLSAGTAAREPEGGPSMALEHDQDGIKLTIPLEITVRLGAGEPVAAVEARRLLRGPGVGALRGGSEAVRIDRDYANRDGYRPGFIKGVSLELPRPVRSLDGKVAPLRAGEAAFEKGELKYQHFSVKLHKSRRMAIFTATNIDGETYLAVDRTSGEVRGGEGDTWYLDERVSDAYYLGRSFYRDWSTYFDRGHLTRRTDPTWGTAEEAERANADTFHLTNCSPQHFRFNQTTRYWQGAERYVLENGLLVAKPRRQVSVFQGPIFDDAVDLWADDVQIPSSFFKVIVWMSEKGLRSVGLVVDQGALLGEERVNLGTPRDVPSVDVSQWRDPIEEIERRTDLDFGEAIRAADTSRRPGQPRVGGEARRRIRSLADILA